MKNIHVLPTDKSSRLSIKDGVLILHRLQWRKGTQNIYITSDEEIKEGDWVFDLDTKRIVKADSFKVTTSKKSQCWYYKKIILTTDQDLIKDGVQAIPDEFLEWFVKNTSCEEVYVKDIRTIPALQLGSPNGHLMYEIIIPKEEPKQELERGINIIHVGKPKQETLNEVALEFAKDHHEMYETSNFGSMYFGFCWGAKWQQERMYSEEEVKHLMTLAFEQGFKKADIVEAGLEAKETDTEVNWIFLKHKK